MKIYEIVDFSPLNKLFKKRFEVVLPKTNRGPDVRDMQQALEALGYTVGPHGLDGIIGPDTSAAIKKYQIANKLVPTGQPTAELVTTLNKQILTNPSLVKTLTPSSTEDVPTYNGPIKKVKNRVSPKEISAYLASKGLDQNHILGMLANIERESNFNSGAYNPNDVNGPSGGLFQHHDNLKTGEKRFSSMVAAAGGETWGSNWKAQLDYALSEADGRRYLAKSFSSPEEATEWWVRKFERPANINTEVAIRQGNLSKYA
jgi:hypothetical protein